MCIHHIVDTTKYVFQGSSLASIEGKTVFVPFSLPGERIEVEIVEEKKSYCRAKIVSIIEPSPLRVLPRCKHFYSCGGCNMQMASDDAQHSLRFESAKEVLQRAHIKLDCPIEFLGGSDWGDRNRFQFHIHNGKPSLLGEKTCLSIPITECPIACKEIQDFLNNPSIFADVEEGRRVHVFAHGGHIWQSEEEKCVSIDILGHNFKFSPSAFFQSNLGMLESLVQLLHTYVGDADRFLDFYSGVGTFSVFFANLVKELHLVEWNKRSLEMAKINIETACKTSIDNKCFFHAISSEKWRGLKASRQLYDVAIVDPPRSGIDKMSLKWFATRKVGRILYVSCDVATFARDAYFLIEEAGYRMEKCYFLDFYPQTHHLEVFGIFNL